MKRSLDRVLQYVFRAVAPPSTLRTARNIAGPTASTNWRIALRFRAAKHFTIDTPVKSSSDEGCGRVIYSSFHIVHGTSNPTYLSRPSSIRTPNGT